MWLGMKLYGRFSETGFRNVVLVFLLISGLTLSLDLVWRPYREPVHWQHALRSTGPVSGFTLLWKRL